MSLIQAYFFQSPPGKKIRPDFSYLNFEKQDSFFRIRLEKNPPGLFILKTFFNMEFLDLELTMTGSMESKSDFKMLVAHFSYMLLLIFKLMTISLKDRVQTKLSHRVI